MFSQISTEKNIVAGLGPFDASINIEDTSYHVYSGLASLLQDPQNAIQIASTNGTSCEKCFSYILPGTLDGIRFMPSQNSPQENPPDGVTAYVSKGAPGYQLDYYPLEAAEFPLTACHLYGDKILLCLMNKNEDLVAGMIKLKST